MPSKVQQARDQFMDWIETGRLRPGQRLDSERELARRMRMNHQTVRRALAELVAEGLIVKRPRIGNFVRDAGDVIPVALVLPSWLRSGSFQRPSTGLTLEGIAQSLNPKRYATTVLFYRPEYFWEDAGHAILSRGIRGILLHAHYRLPAEQLRRLMEKGIHVVGLTRHLHLGGLGFSTFTSDRAAVLAEILTGLRQRGHRRIVVIRYRRPANPSVEAVLTEYENQSELKGLRRRSLWLPNAYELDYGPLDSLFNRRLTAVVAPDEWVVSEIFRRCYQRGMRIPDHFSLAACGDLTPQVHPIPLTAPDSVHWMRQAARQAGDHLQQLLEQTHPPAAQVRFNPPVRWTASVADCNSAPARDRQTRFLIPASKEQVHG